MDKKEFVKDFLETVTYLGKGFVLSFKRESFHYKQLRVEGYDPDKIYKGLANLKRRGFLKENCGKFSFTNEGRRWARNSSFRYLHLNNKNWDRKWRLVIFDIPQELHANRVRLRKKLKNLGLVMLQKSVFVYPYDCGEELGYICNKLGIAGYLDLIIAEDIGFKEKELRKIFGL